MHVTFEPIGIFKSSFQHYFRHNNSFSLKCSEIRGYVTLKNITIITSCLEIWVNIIIALDIPRGIFRYIYSYLFVKIYVVGTH